MRRTGLLLCAVAVVGMMVAPAADAKKKKHKKVVPVAAIAASNPVPSEQTVSATATCPANKTLVGGGFGSGPLQGPFGDTFGTLVLESRRDGANSWKVTALNFDDSGTGTVSAYAYCRKGAAPMTEAQVTISNECSCIPAITAVATCPSGEKSVAGGFTAPFDLVDGGVFPQASQRFGAFAWRFYGIDESFDGSAVTSYVYCAPKARTETSGVRVLTGNEDTGLASGTAYSQLCRKRGQRMLAGGFVAESNFLASTIQLVAQNAAESGRFATTAAQSGFGDGTLQSFGYCG